MSRCHGAGDAGLNARLTMNVVAIVDYGMCNLDSVARAVEECGGVAHITDQPSDLEKASRIILPGVGAFPDAMNNLRQRGLAAALQEQTLDNQIPLLGICLGMQMLADKGWEVSETGGLGLIKGEIRRIEPTAEDRRIPHIGWNEVQFSRPSSLFAGIDSGRDFYFVHSYALCPANEQDVVARTPYARGFVSAVERGSIFGVQFHPEKSQRTGFRLLKNFLSI
jgi:imidazole glycerol-phosphate synthase subunit HisH